MIHFQRQMTIRFIKLYIRYVSPFFAPSCRFTPSCSIYALQAVSKYGIIKGLWLTINRFIRCNPFGGKGYDPVP
ncbi:MAG: membrane protein insertion efficiency factor YidD [Pseudomonadota bacterium]|nr:membrane protein insertion efficiency factor YidD [Pseudomonadota bacterium]